MNSDTKAAIAVIVIILAICVAGMFMFSNKLDKDAEIGYAAWSRNYPQYQLTLNEWKILKRSKSLPR